MLKFHRWFPIKSIRFGLAALALPLLLSCEAPAPRDWLGPSSSETDFQRISVTPRTGRLLIGDSMAVVAWGHRRNGDSVVVNATWTARGGAIYGGRWFHAEAAGYGAIRAISATTPMLVDSAIVQVATVMVTPPDTSVNAGSAIQARALARFPDGTVLTPEVAWSATGGSVSADGLYTAPDHPGIYQLIAQFIGHRISASTRFQVTPAELRLLVLNPSVASVVAGATLQFTLAAAWSDGSSALPVVIWTATGGTISASGLYSAGPTAGTFRVIATASAGGLADTSDVVITVPAPVLTQLALTPSTVSLPPGGMTQYTVSATWSDGSSTVPAVSYAATGGGITPTGLYTAGPTPGSFRVTATHAGGPKADTSAVTISVPVVTLLTLALNPPSVTLLPGGTQVFSVAGAWSDGSAAAPPVSYAATGGVITPAGLYTAGPTPGAFRVIATHLGGTRADTSTVTISVPPPTLTALVLSPSSATLVAGATRQFAVSGTWSDGSATTPAVVYSSSGGTITVGGLYTAGATAGSFRVIATHLGGTRADTSAVTISLPPATLTALVLTPSSATLVAGATRQFEVSGTWSDGSTLAPPVTWSATGGTIAAGGLYTAGATAGTFRVIATHQGGTRADTSAVTISVPPPTLTGLSIAPSSVTLLTGGTQQFAASGTWSDGATTAPVVTYTATGGTIAAAGGLYTAGATAGTFRVIATHQGGTRADTASVTITVPPPTLTSLVLNPSAVTLETGGTRQFAVSGTWSDGSSATPAVNYSSTGGTITAGGVYTAGATPGTFRVIATHQGGTRADTSAVTVNASQSAACLRTVNVSTVIGLTTALSQAVPGDCILLAPGTYSLSANLTIARSGTQSAPIIVEGVGSNTVIDVNQRYLYLDASFVHLRNLRLTNFGGYGLWLRGVTGVILDSLEIDHTLQEAVALTYGSHHNTIKNSLFHNTGIGVAQYGEGIYIGTTGNQIYPRSLGATDNQILNNHFGPNVRAQALDIKEGADRTIVRGNFFDGTGSVRGPGTGSLVAIIANDVVVDSNFFQFGNIHGVSFIKPATTTMAGNLMTRNTIDLRDNWQAQRGTVIPYGFQFQAGTVDPMGAVIACNNVMISGLLSNVPCTVYP